MAMFKFPEPNTSIIMFDAKRLSVYQLIAKVINYFTSNTRLFTFMKWIVPLLCSTLFVALLNVLGFYIASSKLPLISFIFFSFTTVNKNLFLAD